jgi:hypothetical protein
MTGSRTTLSTRSRLLLALVVASLGLQTMAYAEDSPICHQWLEKVAQAPKHVQAKVAASEGGSTAAIVGLSSDPWDVASLTEPEKLNAIECLLGAENDLRPAAFSGVTRFDISQTFAPAHVNLAALYAVSYIYSGHYDHAAAVALRGADASYTDSHGNYVTKASTIHKAYKAYRAWFAKVRQMGLASAQQSGLQPLEGTGLRWY